MLHVVTSDLHLGSPYSRRQDFLRFLSQLPAAATLVLNGDVVDDPTQPLAAPDLMVLATLDEEASRRPLFVVPGNHDREFDWAHYPNLRVAPDYRVPGRLLAAHGDYFDTVMPQHRWFMRLFAWVHGWRIRLGAPPVHVAQYAKCWPLLYRVLRRRVMRQAVERARELGLPAVTCGHVHFAEAVDCEGVCYLNTGCWTEPDSRYVVLEEAGPPRLLEFRP